MTLTRRGIDESDLAAGDIELFFPPEMPFALGLAPRVTVAGLVSPLPNVLDRENSG